MLRVTEEPSRDIHGAPGLEPPARGRDLEGAGRLGARMVVSMVTISRACALLTVALGLFVLTGYLTRTEWAIRVRPGLPPMYPIAAISFVLGGIGAWTVRTSHRVGQAVSLAASLSVLAIGAIDLTLHALGARPTVFDIYPADPVVPATSPIPGRPVAETGLSLAVLGMSLVLAAVRRAPRLSQVLAFTGLMIGTSALLGYAIGVDRAELGRSLVAIGMALHTSVGLILMAVATLLSRPGTGFLRTLVDAGPAGRLGRRLLFVAVVAPMLFAAVDAFLVARYSQDELTASWFAVVQVVALAALIVVPIRALEQYEAAAAHEDELQIRDLEAAGSGALVADLLTADIRGTLPEIPGFSAAAAFEPAHGHIAGDSLQVLPRDSSTLVALVDVAGHDARAGTLAFQLRTHVKALWSVGTPLERIVHELNCAVVAEETLASGIFLLLDHPRGHVTYLNAGHPPGIVVRGATAERLRATGPVLGLESARHRLETVDLPPGATLVIFTDGLYEARNAARKELGEEQVLRTVTAVLATEGVADVCQALIDLARTHTGGRLRDDIFVAALRRDSP